MKQKYIITDIDGVVLDWEEGFSVWAEHHGHEKVEGYQFINKFKFRSLCSCIKRKKLSKVNGQVCI